MFAMLKEEIFKKSMSACKAVADRVESIDDELTPLEIKMMVEEELGYGLDPEQMLVLALTFKHIDNLFEMVVDDSVPDMLYR